MLGLWIFYGLVVVAGIATPMALQARDRRIDAQQNREAIEGIAQDVHTLGMLSGGPGRMVDAIVTDLVERGVVVAENGSLAVSPGHTDQDLGMRESFAVRAVRDVGHEGIWEVRRWFGETRLPFRSVSTS